MNGVLGVFFFLFFWRGMERGEGGGRRGGEGAGGRWKTDGQVRKGGDTQVA